MLAIHYKASFIRKLNALDAAPLEEAIEKIELLRDPRNHRLLKVHKLHGPLAGAYSFSVNYKMRIVFHYISKNEVALLSIGDHEVYD